MVKFMSVLFSTQNGSIQPLSTFNKSNSEINEAETLIISQDISKIFNLQSLNHVCDNQINAIAWDEKNLQVNAIFYMPVSDEPCLKCLFRDMLEYKDLIVESAKKELTQCGLSKKQDISLKFVFVQNNINEQCRKAYDSLLQNYKASDVLIEYFEILKTDTGVFSLQPYHSQFTAEHTKQNKENYDENYHLSLSDNDTQEVYLGVKKSVLDKYPQMTIKSSLKTTVQFLLNDKCIMSFVFKQNYIKVWLNPKKPNILKNAHSLFLPIGDKHHNGIGSYFCDLNLDGYANMDINELYRLIDMTIKSYG